MLAPKTDVQLKWLSSTFKRWVAIVKPTDDDFLAADLTSIQQSFPGAAPGSLSKIFREIKTEKGDENPPKTWHQLFILTQVMANKLGSAINMTKDREYLCVRQSVDERMQRRARLDYQTPPLKAEMITEDMEKTLWERSILGYDDPVKLVRTVYYIIGVHFALRAKDDDRRLRNGADAQIKVIGMNQKIVYLEGASKSHSGGLCQAQTQRRCHNPNRGAKLSSVNCSQAQLTLDNCLLNKLPPDARTFYCRPKITNHTAMELLFGTLFNQ